MRVTGYTNAYNNDVLALLSSSFGMTREESRILLDDALRNGKCMLGAVEHKTVSVALCKDVTLRFGGKDRKGVYVFGLCTAEEHRGAGFASNLLGVICDNSDAQYAVLIPENDDLFFFYEKLGFLPNGYGASLTVKAAGKTPVMVVDSLSVAYAAYRHAAETCGDICLLSESDLAASLSLSRQTCVTGENGVCFVGDRVETLAPPGEALDLSASALHLVGIPQTTVITPLSSAPVGAKALPLGMIKALRGATPPERFYINNLFNL